MPQAADSWKDYRQRRRLLLWAVLAGLAACAGGVLLARARHSVGPFYAGLAALAGAAAWGAQPLADFPCPHCGETFAHRGRTRNLFTRSCLHCRQPLPGRRRG